MTPSELHEIRSRHRAEDIPEHHWKNRCDACRLLFLVDAQTQMLDRLIARKDTDGTPQTS